MRQNAVETASWSEPRPSGSGPLLRQENRFPTVAARLRTIDGAIASRLSYRSRRRYDGPSMIWGRVTCRGTVHRRGCGLRFLMWCVVIGLPCLGRSASFAESVTFGPAVVKVGSQYGRERDSTPGDVLLVQDGITVSLEEFVLRSYVGFEVAEFVGTQPGRVDFDALRLDNISVEFDLSALGFKSAVVTIEYCRFGGELNLGINGRPVIQLRRLSSLPSTALML